MSHEEILRFTQNDGVDIPIKLKKHTKFMLNEAKSEY
jgi:hypothetical protein